MRSNNLPALLALFLAGAAGLGASDNVPAVRSTKPLLLRGATVHTVSGADLPATDVLLQDGKIAAIGVTLVVPAGATIVDVTGKHISPD